MKLVKLLGIDEFINTGTQEVLDEFENRKIKLTNSVALIIMLASLMGIGLFLAGFFLYDAAISIVQGAISILQMLFIFAVIFFNRRHHYYYARLILVLSSIATVFALGLFFQPESGNNFFFLLGPLGIFVFLGLNNYAYTLVFFSFMIVLLTQAYQAAYPALLPIPGHMTGSFYIVSIMVVFVLVALMTYLLMKINQDMEKSLIDTMQRDALTGLYNRLKYNDFIRTSVPKAAEDTVHISIIALDIDYFKKYNDTYGHLVGDEALINVANVLKTYENDRNILATRFGGEEFTMVLYDVDMASSIEMAESILEDIRRKSIPHEASLVSDILTCSAGVASYIPTMKNVDNLSYIFGEADKKLYEAKAGGRNRVAS